MNRFFSILLLLPAFAVAAPGPHKVIHVSLHGPYTTVQQAADRALPGDTIVVPAGVYRQTVLLQRGGDGEGSRLVFRAARGVVFEGAFTAARPGVNYITIQGFGFRGLTLPAASMEGGQPGAIATNGGTHWIIRGNSFIDIAGVAISIGQTGHAYPVSKPNGPAYSDLTTSLDSVGHHLIAGNHFSRCSQAAIFGLLHGSGSIIEDNVIDGAGTGIQLAVAIDVIIRHNTIRCTGGRGIWLGPLYQGARITDNIVKAADAFYLFDSHGPLLLDHNRVDGNVVMVGVEANIFVKNVFRHCRVVNDSLPMRPWATSNYLPHSLVIKQTIPVLPLEDQWYGNRFDTVVSRGRASGVCPRIDAAAIGIIPLSKESIEDPQGRPLTVVANGPVLAADTAYTAWPLNHRSPQVHPQPFVHPGLLHTNADLQRIKDGIARGLEPWKSGFAVFAADPASSADYRPHPAAHVERSLLAGKGLNIGALEKDGNAAYQNALMWCITGEEAHARKAIEILDGWASTLQVFDGTDIELGAGINALKFANAAELMRYSYPAWPVEHVRRCQEMLRRLFYPPLQYFALWAHGNWDIACMKGMMAIGIFTDDHALFDRAVDYYYHGRGNGSLDHYIINADGQVQESGRDQQHTQLGIGQLAEICQMAWSQGLDLYSADSCRLLRGFEYVARYNLGEDVPFTPYADQSHRFPATHISDQGRGRLRTIYEMAYNHYRHTGLPEARFKYTRMAALKLRPEGAGFGADHPGFGTLLFGR